MTDDVTRFVPEVLRIMDEELLATPEQWTKGEDHIVVDGTDCYCLRGARTGAVVMLFQGDDFHRACKAGSYLARDVRIAVKSQLLRCIKENYGGNVGTPQFHPTNSETNFNDHAHTTFEDVKKVIKCAREKTNV